MEWMSSNHYYHMGDTSHTKTIHNLFFRNLSLDTVWNEWQDPSVIHKRDFSRWRESSWKEGSGVVSCPIYQAV